jgi:hypothetical protein
MRWVRLAGSRFPAAQQTQHRITRSTSPSNPFTATRNLEHGPLGDSASKFDKPSLRCDHDVAIDWSVEKGKTDIGFWFLMSTQQNYVINAVPPANGNSFPRMQISPALRHSQQQHAACSSNAYRRRPKTCKTLLLIKHSPSCQPNIL